MIKLITKLKDSWFALPAPTELKDRLVEAAERELAQTEVDVKAARRRAELLARHTIDKAYHATQHELLEAEAELEDVQARVQALRARAERLAPRAYPLQLPELRDA